MFLRKLACAACACVLACGLFACGGQRGETYAPKYDGSGVPVEQADIMTSRKVTNQGFLNLLERMRGSEYLPLAKSRIVSRQQSYRNHWNRVVYYAFPKFTNELSGAGARKIKQYYKEQYQQCAAQEDFPWLETYEEIEDTPEAAMQYRLQVYAVSLLEDYVVVKFTSDAFTGGNRTQPSVSADVFARTTGDKLALGDVVNMANAADAVNKAVADHLRLKDIRPNAPYDLREAQGQAFSLTEEYLVLLFDPGVLAPSAYGVLEVPVALAVLGEQ